jgi:thiol-disulfide isomerase/thioredoxin
VRSFAALLALAWSGCAHVSESTLTLNDFVGSLPAQVAGRTPLRPELLRGKVVLVTFVATWCFPCLTELEALGKLDRDYGQRGFENVLVGMDLEGAKVLEPFAAQYALTWPLVVADDRVRAGVTPFGPIVELPSRVLFARDGSVVVGYAGVAKYQDLARIVERELGRERR